MKKYCKWIEVLGFCLEKEGKSGCGHNVPRRIVYDMRYFELTYCPYCGRKIRFAK